MINPVEEYLKTNQSKMLSLKNISKELRIKRKKTDYFIHRSKNIRHVEPFEVGSGKHKLNIYTYNF